jgi:hypothetical protein
MSSSSKNVAVSIAAIGVAMSLLIYVLLVIYDGPDKFVPSVFAGALSSVICFKIVDCWTRRRERIATTTPSASETGTRPHVTQTLDGSERLETMLLGQKASGVTVDPALEEAIATHRISDGPRDQQTLSFVIIRMRPRLTDEVLLEINRLKDLRPATSFELIAFMKAMPHLSLITKFTRVVALGDANDADRNPLVVALQFTPFVRNDNKLWMTHAGYAQHLAVLPRSTVWGEETAILAVIK